MMKWMFLLMVLILIVGCSVKELSDEEVYSIVKTDKDYGDFIQKAKGFEPVLVSKEQFSDEEYNKVRDEWLNETSDMYGLVEYIDGIELNDNTYMVEYKDVNNDKQGLLAFVDINEKKSLFIVDLVTIEAGISG